MIQLRAYISTAQFILEVALFSTITSNFQTVFRSDRPGPVIINGISRKHAPPRSPRVRLTDDLQRERRLVLEVVHLHAHLVHAGVGPVGGADEQDAVFVGAAHVHLLGVQRLAVLRPADHGFGFALVEEEGKNVRTAPRQVVARWLFIGAHGEGDGEVDLLSFVSDVSLPEETGQAHLGTI